MSWVSGQSVVTAGDLVQLLGARNKSFLLKVVNGGTFQSHRGVIEHDQIIGKPWGSKVATHIGRPFFILQPSLASVLNELPRTTQILYPKDIGYALLQMGIGEGERVIEAGTGSGAMTSALAFMVGMTGRVYSYDVREDIQALARKNLQQLELDSRVDFKIRDIADGFDETNVDAFFLDVQSPSEYMQQVRTALSPGGFFGSLVPTMNQVTRLLDALRQFNFAFIDICEILIRFYKAETERFRPVDRMIAHTGFLVFARKVMVSSEDDKKSLVEIDPSQPHVLRLEQKQHTGVESFGNED